MSKYLGRIALFGSGAKNHQVASNQTLSTTPQSASTAQGKPQYSFFGSIVSALSTLGNIFSSQRSALANTKESSQKASTPPSASFSFDAPIAPSRVQAQVLPEDMPSQKHLPGEDTPSPQSRRQSMVNAPSRTEPSYNNRPSEISPSLLNKLSPEARREVANLIGGGVSEKVKVFESKGFTKQPRDAIKAKTPDDFQADLNQKVSEKTGISNRNPIETGYFKAIFNNYEKFFEELGINHDAILIKVAKQTQLNQACINNLSANMGEDPLDMRGRLNIDLTKQGADASKLFYINYLVEAQSVILEKKQSTKDENLSKKLDILDAYLDLECTKMFHVTGATPTYGSDNAQTFKRDSIDNIYDYLKETSKDIITRDSIEPPNVDRDSKLFNNSRINNLIDQTDRGKELNSATRLAQNSPQLVKREESVLHIEKVTSRALQRGSRAVSAGIRSLRDGAIDGLARKLKKDKGFPSISFGGDSDDRSQKGSTASEWTLKKLNFLKPTDQKYVKRYKRGDAPDTGHLK